MAQDVAAAKVAEDKPAKTVCLVQEVVIEGKPMPRGTEYAADSDVVKRCLAPNDLVMPKALFDKVDAAEKAKTQAAAEAAEAGKV